jgi:hypothetical protein
VIQSYVCRLRSLVGLLSCILLGSAATTARAQMPIAPDHQHDWDFEFGAWRARVTMQLSPLGPDRSWVTLVGTSVVRKIWGGRGNIGELEIGNAAHHLEGLTVRLYDPRAREWSVYFANGKTGDLEVPGMVGRFENGRGEFYDRELFAGKPIRVRFLFSRITQKSFRFVQSFSQDGGKTWLPNWIATFTR